MTNLSRSSVSHTDSATVAAFLDGQLRGRSHSEFVAHLAECAPCRREVVELQQALGIPLGASTKRRYPLSFIAAIAAVLLMAIVVPTLRTMRSFGTSNEERVRADVTNGGDRSAQVEVIEPVDGAEISAGAMELSWRSAGRNAMYVVTIQDSVGTEMWSHTGIDTVVTLPETVGLQTRARYFWSVQVQRADGYSTKSVLQSFRVK